MISSCIWGMQHSWDNYQISEVWPFSCFHGWGGGGGGGGGGGRGRGGGGGGGGTWTRSARPRRATYRSRALLGACAYNSTGRKYAPISEMRLITNIIIMTFLE